MTSTDTHAALNRLLVLHHRSLPRYLGYARPWHGPGQEDVRETLAYVVTAQTAMAERIGEFLWEGGQPVDFGEFPLAYTALHDLSCDYLLRKLLEAQTRMVAEIQECVETLRLAPLAQTLAQEALGEAKGHLDSLRELHTQPAGAA